MHVFFRLNYTYPFSKKKKTFLNVLFFILANLFFCIYRVLGGWGCDLHTIYTGLGSRRLFFSLLYITLPIYDFSKTPITWWFNGSKCLEWTWIWSLYEKTVGRRVSISRPLLTQPMLYPWATEPLIDFSISWSSCAKSIWGSVA